ncbi:hypothetical protein [Kribbella speibonae]|uniref:Uncharacterized protein n=1 Tax=Kribbella speibonae TaxID=1572660 RepID=A0ABY2AF16_9ACTN|nr:hypothetical protein [Kribbella speibonae]TCC26906.1 hypothetical protein E0H58_02555 [Kribbella speibonae]
MLHVSSTPAPHRGAPEPPPPTVFTADRVVRRVMAVLLAALLVGLLLAAMPSAQAAPDPRLTITEVSLDRTAVAVSGLNTVAVQVRVKGGYDSADPNDANLPLNVWLQRTSGSGFPIILLSTDLPRVSGTTQNGEWAGPVYVPSTANGKFTVIGVTTGPHAVYETGPMPPDPTPVAAPPILTVTGYHLPKITAKVTPAIVPFGSGFSITWAVIDSATGKPYATRFRVLVGVDSQCDQDVGGDLPLTSPSGTVVKTYPASAANALVCLRIPGRGGDIASLKFFVARPGIVSAVPSKTSAPVGTIVPVNGSVAGAPQSCKVWLQRLYGATQWRSVSSGAVRASGRFTVNAQPAYKGLIPYRVYFPTCYHYQAGLSKVFYIRGL